MKKFSLGDNQVQKSTLLKRYSEVTFFYEEKN